MGEADGGDNGKLGRNFLKGSLGDAVNIILSAAGQNIRKLLRLLKDFYPHFLLALPRKIDHF